MVADGSGLLITNGKRIGSRCHFRPTNAPAGAPAADERRLLLTDGYECLWTVTRPEARLRVVTPLRLSEPVLQPGQALPFSASDADGELLTAADLLFFQMLTTNLSEWQPIPNGAHVHKRAALAQRCLVAGSRAVLPLCRTRCFACASAAAVAGSFAASWRGLPDRVCYSDGGRLTLSMSATSRFRLTRTGTWVKLSTSLSVSNGTVRRRRPRVDSSNALLSRAGKVWSSCSSVGPVCRSDLKTAMKGAIPSDSTLHRATAGNLARRSSISRRHPSSVRLRLAGQFHSGHNRN